MSNSSGKGEVREVPVSWEALEDAFENNSPEVHSYLHLDTGEVIRIVDGIADPAMHTRVSTDSQYLRIDPVSSREQYRWMERFIDSVDESVLRTELVRAIDGKGAFRRFKDVLMSFPVDRERWFTFRSDRLRACMEAWLTAHGIDPIARPSWQVPSADEVKENVQQQESVNPGRESRAAIADTHRAKAHEMVDLLPARELDAALAYLEFLRERKRTPRAQAKAAEAPQAPQSDDDGHENGHEDSADSASGAKPDVPAN
ncbi:MAG: hypothetical protein JRH11_16885 [Deltaproteobacteria bacterium]|nr:hypothetical protein [Deltaproteobacteria bacterium]